MKKIIAISLSVVLAVGFLAINTAGAYYENNCYNGDCGWSNNSCSCNNYYRDWSNCDNNDWWGSDRYGGCGGIYGNTSYYSYNSCGNNCGDYYYGNGWNNDWTGIRYTNSYYYGGFNGDCGYDGSGCGYYNGGLWGDADDLAAQFFIN